MLPYDKKVEFTGSGVIAQGLFYPYKVKELTGIDNVVTPKSDSYLALYRYFQTGKGQAADQLLYLAGSDGIDTIPLIDYNFEASQYFQHSNSLQIVLPKGFKLYAPDSEILTLYRGNIIYAEIERYNILDELTEKTPSGYCGFLSWLKGECVHGID